MLRDLILAVGELRDRDARTVVWRGVLISLVTLALLVVAAERLITWLADTGYLWVDRVAEVLGLLGTLVVAWLLFPAIVVAASSFFLERVVQLVEARDFATLPPARTVPTGEGLWAAARLLCLALLLNLVALPLYFVPGINLPLWAAINGWLVGREYFELVALRRAPAGAVRQQRRRQRARIWLTGIVVAVLLTLPVVNLVAPMIGAAFMTRRFHRWQLAAERTGLGA